ncbi:MAG TPA: IMS domain-containing protein [Planktothrix sp.]|jgi:hypothetical protein
MQKRKPVHILTFALAVAMSVALTRQAAADSSSALDNMWNDQSKGSAPAQSPSVPPDTTPSLGPDQPDMSQPATGAPAPDAPASSAPAPDAGATSSAPAPAAESGAASSMPDNSPDTSASSPPANSTPEAPQSLPSTPAPVPVAPASTPAAADEEHKNMCSVDDFTSSDLVQYTSWPGVGPFRGAAPNFTDPNQNKITIDINDGKVSSAQMSVADAPSDLLKLQMSADFLLESVGAKPGKIASFNDQLEKARPQLATSTSTDPINLTAGSYSIAIFPQNQTSDSLNYIITVVGNSAAPIVVKRTFTSPPPLRTATTPPVTTSAIASTTTTTTTSAKVDSTSSDTTVISMVPSADSGSSTSTTTTSSTSPELKKTFVDLINKWQSVKRTAVRARDTGTLASVLSGKALQQQTSAIKWLSDNHKYYLMNPGKVMVDRYEEVVKDQKYAVYAQVSESKKYMDDTSDEVLKDTSTTYNVKYTVDKVGDHWVIDDSEVLNPPPPVKASR